MTNLDVNNSQMFVIDREGLYNRLNRNRTCFWKLLSKNGVSFLNKEKGAYLNL